MSTFLWDGQTLLLEADAGDTTQAHYTAAPGGYGPTVAQRRGATSSFYHPTDLGTIDNLTDASGNVTDSYAFTAFGVPVATSGTTMNPHRYIGALGYYTDPTTGLDYVRARYLRPATGSWLSVDPVPSEPRYQYVGGRVTGATDASGYAPPSYDECQKQRQRCLDSVRSEYSHCLQQICDDSVQDWIVYGFCAVTGASGLVGWVAKRNVLGWALWGACVVVGAFELGALTPWCKKRCHDQYIEQMIHCNTWWAGNCYARIGASDAAHGLQALHGGKR